MDRVGRVGVAVVFELFGTGASGGVGDVYLDVFGVGGERAV